MPRQQSQASPEIAWEGHDFVATPGQHVATVAVAMTALAFLVGLHLKTTSSSSTSNSMFVKIFSGLKP